MKEQLIEEIQSSMLGILDNWQLEKLKLALDRCLSKVKIEAITDKTIRLQEESDNQKFVEMFLAAKRIEGCSEKSLKYYQSTIVHLLIEVPKSVKRIETDDLRTYLGNIQEQKSLSRVTVDNVRRVLSSFFSWLEDEDYILKSPVRRIHKVKTGRVVRETFTDEGLEILRDSCDKLRDLAMIDLLSSTGMRVGELVLLNQEDIDFEERECIVLGKGNSERIVCFDARTKIHLQNYLQARHDKNKALFVTLARPFNRLQIGGVENRLRKLGDAINLPKVHPHKFRRTMATRAIDKGMPIEQVQRLLGHVKIDTTMHYAMVNQSNVKIAHRKYIG